MGEPGRARCTALSHFRASEHLRLWQTTFVQAKSKDATKQVLGQNGHMSKLTILISLVIQDKIKITLWDLLNHDSYVYVHKYLGEAYFPVSVGAKK